MIYTLSITEAAENDALEAYLYYEKQEPGLGERFLSVLMERFDNLSTHPDYYSYINDKQLYRDIDVSPFPYLIIYEIIQTKVIIYSVHLTHRQQKNNYK